MKATKQTGDSDYSILSHHDLCQRAEAMRAMLVYVARWHSYVFTEATISAKLHEGFEQAAADVRLIALERRR